ncbi:MAG: hypothetical protein H0W74_14115 [Sphingosinicella sp.]|nr:hypothetical protein [Sphingosinicella sp.]
MKTVEQIQALAVLFEARIRSAASIREEARELALDIHQALSNAAAGSFEQGLSDLIGGDLC